MEKNILWVDLCPFTLTRKQTEALTPRSQKVA